MLKAKHIPLLITVSVLLVCFLSIKVFARALTESERKNYAQNNILFYSPCDSEDDCEGKSSPEGPDNPDYPSDPGNPDTPSDPGDPLTPSGAGAEKIVNMAIAMAWPNENGQCRQFPGGSSYREWHQRSKGDTPCNNTLKDSVKALGYKEGNNVYLQDCGKFVGLVIKRSGVDDGFPGSIVHNQMDHMVNTPSKWKVIFSSDYGNPFNKSLLKPGDVLAFSTKKDKKNIGHIMIYVGTRTVKCRNGSTCTVHMAEAGLNTYTPTLTSRWSLVSPSTQVNYRVYRYIGN